MTRTEPLCVPLANGLVLRDCTLDDAATIAEIYNQAVRAGGSTMDSFEKSEEEIRAQIGGFHEREVILILEQADEILGWGIIKRYSDRLGYRVACETSVYLHFDHRRKGYGTLMKRALIDRCRHYGYHHVVAKIFADNQASIEYNRKLGFEVVGVQKEIGFVNGRWHDVVIMQLILDDVPPFRPDLG